MDLETGRADTLCFRMSSYKQTGQLYFPQYFQAAIMWRRQYERQPIRTQYRSYSLGNIDSKQSTMEYVFTLSVHITRFQPMAVQRFWWWYNKM